VSGAFANWDGREPLSLFPHVTLHAIGGVVPPHSHEHTEQVMYVLEGSLEMTVGSETRELGEGDVVVVNRGVEHSLRSDAGCAFFEALSPVPLDHVPDRELDLVLGADAGRLHVEH
jgi:quercetin dioxygenase-like cupin family protein